MFTIQNNNKSTYSLSENMNIKSLNRTFGSNYTASNVTFFDIKHPETAVFVVVCCKKSKSITFCCVNLFIVGCISHFDWMFCVCLWVLFNFYTFYLEFRTHAFGVNEIWYYYYNKLHVCEGKNTQKKLSNSRSIKEKVLLYSCKKIKIRVQDVLEKGVLKKQYFITFLLREKEKPFKKMLRSFAYEIYKENTKNRKIIV